MDVGLCRGKGTWLYYVCVHLYTKEQFLLWAIFLLAKIIVSVEPFLSNCKFVIR